MGRQLTPIDITMLVFGILMMILTISLFAVAGDMVKISNSSHQEVSQYVNYLQLGVGAWYLVTSTFAIVSGATGQKCPYVTVIVLSILAIFVAISGAVLAILFAFTEVLEDLTPQTPLNTLAPYYPYYTVSPDPELVKEAFAGLPEGVMVINLLSFVFMIVISCVSCCGTCCNSSAQMPAAEPMHHTTVVTTSGGYGYTPVGPPSYVSHPPNQTHVYSGICNPNYADNDTGMDSNKTA